MVPECVIKPIHIDTPAANVWDTTHSRGELPEAKDESPV